MTLLNLTPDHAARFAAIALGHVRREYPHKPDQVLAGPEDARPPSVRHPVFHGSFDWHSCVHAHWMLARLVREFPDLAVAPKIAALIDAQFTPEKINGECATVAAPSARSFERPYGWAWLLKLAAELAAHADQRWARRLAPLTVIFAERLRAFLPLATYPVRSGAHSNTAFALRMAADYASVAGDTSLNAHLGETARRWYVADADCPAWGEPGGDDFLSPTLIEAECLRRILPVDDFRPWFDRFLPRLAQGEPATLLRPAVVSDRADGKIAHLDGLNLSRAWCWRALAGALPPRAPRRAVAADAAARHLAASLPHIADDYAGEHWLASFAVLALGAEG